MGRRTTKETKVTEGHAASIPAEIRRRFHIKPGDRLVWHAEGDEIVVTPKRGRRAAFDDFEPFDFGVETNATDEHDAVY